VFVGTVLVLGVILSFCVRNDPFWDNKTFIKKISFVHFPYMH
jgi:hypothetical protein